MNKANFFVSCCTILLLTSCVKKKDFEALQMDRDTIETKMMETSKLLTTCNEEKSALEGTIANLESTIASKTSELGSKDSQIQSLEADVKTQKGKTEAVYSSLSDLSILSTSEVAQFRKAVEGANAMSEGDATKSNAITTLSNKMRKALDGSAGQDIQISNRGGAIFISLANKILFKPGSAKLTASGPMILQEVAKILTANSSIDVMVEGHTDADPIAFTSNKDNWDLSIKRAVAVVRSLQNEHNIAPNRLVASGRGEHRPIADNGTDEGKQMNRRTEIILVPRLSQYLNLISE